MTTARTRRAAQRAYEVFLVELARCGNVSEAARVAGLGRRSVYDHRVADKEFAQAWDDALQQGTDRMVGEAIRRAVDGIEEPVYGRVARDQDGQIGTIRRYSDTLLKFLLTAHRPEVYAPRQQIEHSGTVPIKVYVANDDFDPDSA